MQLPMNRDIEYRFRLAEGYLEEAKQDLGQGHWRSSIYGAILAIENSGIGALMQFGVSPSTHKPGRHLRHLLSEGTVSEALAESLEVLLPIFGRHDSQEKMLAKYGDETSFRLPWELFGEAEAREAFRDAQAVYRICRDVSGPAASKTRET